jgi:hypothetical protein
MIVLKDLGEDYIKKMNVIISKYMDNIQPIINFIVKILNLKRREENG